jgi:hypothetical protein
MIFLLSILLCFVTILYLRSLKKAANFYRKCRSLDSIFKAFILSNKLEKNPSFFVPHCYHVQAEDYTIKCEPSKDGFTYILINKKK